MLTLNAVAEYKEIKKLKRNIHIMLIIAHKYLYYLLDYDVIQP